VSCSTGSLSSASVKVQDMCKHKVNDTPRLKTSRLYTQRPRAKLSGQCVESGGAGSLDWGA